MRDVDRAAGGYGLAVPVLMECAGTLVARAAARMLRGRDPGGDPDLVSLHREAGARWGRWRPRPLGDRVLVLAGRGNNGGDGMVAARYLHEWGFRVSVLLAGEPESLGEAPRAEWRLLERLGVACRPLPPDPAACAAAVKGAAAQADLAVDALVGTGARLPLGGVLEAAAAALGVSGLPVLAVDIPSGLDPDGGTAPGVCVRADVTVTMCRPKVGMLLDPEARSGEILVALIPIPAVAVRERGPGARLLTARQVAAWLPARPPWGHKGTFGHVVVVAGAVGYAGAPALAAMGALRGGAGLVTVAVPTPLEPVLAAKLTEAMVRPLPASGGALTEEAWPVLEELLERADAVVAGPGLGRGEATRRLLRRLMAGMARPLVLDADGLNLLDAETIAGYRGPLALTPHPGEMARLLNVDAARVVADRGAAVREAARRCRPGGPAAGGAPGGGGYGAGSAAPRRACLLKGYRTLVADEDGRLLVNPTGNQGMATAGSGDVLSGVIGAFLAQGMGVWEAAAAAVYVHGLAGDIAAARRSDRAMVAGDILDALGDAFRMLAGAGSGGLPPRGEAAPPPEPGEA